MDFYILFMILTILINLFMGIFSDCKKKREITENNRTNFFNGEIEGCVPLKTVSILPSVYKP